MLEACQNFINVYFLNDIHSEINDGANKHWKRENVYCTE